MMMKVYVPNPQKRKRKERKKENQCRPLVVRTRIEEEVTTTIASKIEDARSCKKAATAANPSE